MADTAITGTALSLNSATANPAGTAIVHANTHVITPTGASSKLAIRLTNTAASEKVMTILAGDNPPADAAGQGDLAITFAAGDSTPVVKWVVIESARFIQNNGTIRIDVAASTTGNIAAIELP
jgi:hypothetical protein